MYVEVAMAWTLQRKHRAKGWYYEAIHRTRPGVKPRCLTLGYLDDGLAQAVRGRLDSSGDELVALDDDVVRGWLTMPADMPRFAPSEVAAIVEGAKRQIPPFYPFDWNGDYLGPGGVEVEVDEDGHMQARAPITRTTVPIAAAAPPPARPVAPARPPAPTRTTPTLRAFVESTWKAIRKSERASGTWDREWHLWSTRILPTLGEVQLHRLDLARWQGFLASCTSWGARTKQLAQVAYRTCLKYAVEIGILETTHPFRPIRGATQPTLAPPEPLTPKEVDALLDAARTAVHRCLFAVAVGQGLRPGEVVAIHHEDVDLTEGEEALFIRGGSKNVRARTKVPLTPVSIREIKAFRKHLEESGLAAAGPMFLWKGKQIKKFRSALRSAAKRAELNERRQRAVFPYLFRHTFATTAAVEGVPKAATRAMMRHSKHSTILEQAYEHLRPDQVREAFASAAGFGGGTTLPR
jgi:integrase